MRTVLGVNLYDKEEVGTLLGVGIASVTKYAQKAKVYGRIIERRKYYTEEEIRSILCLSGNNRE